MNCLPLVLYVVSLLHSVLGSLPAPHNVSISSSFNFHHVLHWDPGPGTPPGTQYKIIRRINRKELKQLPYSKTTSFALKLPRYTAAYVVTVQASYNQTLSPESRKVTFTPFTQTTIGPPTVSLAGCGNCIRINISLPEVDQRSGIKDDMKTIYPGVLFRVFWRKPNEAAESIITNRSSITVNNLQTGTQYCVQVWTKINVNRNTQPSAWNCTFTSIVEPSRDVYVIGAVAALVLLVCGVLMTLMFCLHYTGFICKLKETLPRVLHEALSPGSTLTPERTIPDKIAIRTEPEKQNKRNNGQPTRGTNSDEEEEVEEEEGENVYMDRGADISSGESSGQDSANVLGNSKVAASGGSGSLIAEVPDTEIEVEVSHDHDEAKADGEEVSFMPEGPVTAEEEEEEEEEEEYKEEVCESSGNINLFSVTLAALAVGEEEEEEQNERDPFPDFLKESDLEPLLPSDSQTESGDQTTVALMLQEDSTVSGYEGRRANTSDGESQDEETQEEAEEEEEEEEFSGYLCNR